MALVPAGKRRIMVAQLAPQQNTGLDLPNAETPNAAAGASPEDANNLPQDPAAELKGDVDKIKQEQENPENTEAIDGAGDDDDVKATVFEFLTKLGFPPRRLREFKAQFTSETDSASGGTAVTVKIPDSVYGQNKPIPREALKKFVQVVQEKHGLSYQKMTRSNEQVIIEFISNDAAKRQSMEDNSPGDILDKVYTSGGKKGGKSLAPPKAAQTIQELIKESKDKQVALIKKLGIRTS